MLNIKEWQKAYSEGRFETKDIVNLTDDAGWIDGFVMMPDCIQELKR